MSRVKNEIGNKYGRLTVIERAGSTSGGIALWKCKCDCGNETVVAGSKLRNGCTVSCGCRMKETGKENFQSLIGQKFGKLTVLERTNNINNKVAYKCKCDCGNVIITRADYLKNGTIKSCGCMRGSAGENAIEILLKKNNIIYEKEKTFPDLLSIKDRKTPYRYDFFLPQLNRLIEFDGLQHSSSQADNYFNRPLIELQQIDVIKNNYAKEHGYSLIRIPYNKLSSLVIDDLLTDRFII